MEGGGGWSIVRFGLWWLGFWRAAWVFFREDGRSQTGRTNLGDTFLSGWFVRIIGSRLLITIWFRGFYKIIRIAAINRGDSI